MEGPPVPLGMEEGVALIQSWWGSMRRGVFADEERDRLRQGFASLDTDGSGSVDAGELHAALALLGDQPLEQDEIEALLRAGDADGNGTIDVSEFMALADLPGYVCLSTDTPRRVADVCKCTPELLAADNGIDASAMDRPLPLGFVMKIVRRGGPAGAGAGAGAIPSLKLSSLVGDVDEAPAAAGPPATSHRSHVADDVVAPGGDGVDVVLRLARVKETVFMLGYDSELVDTRSAPLVEQVCTDLVRSMETVERVLGNMREVEGEAVRAKAALEPLRVENGRLVGENAALHLRAIQEAEGFDARERGMEGRVKVLEQDKAELEFCVETLTGRVVEQEAEIMRMRARLEACLKLEDAWCNEARADRRVRLHVSELLHPKRAVGRASAAAQAGAPAVAGDQVPGEQRGLEGQVQNLAQLLQETREARDALEEQVSRLTDEVEAREREVARLGNMLEGEGQGLRLLTTEHSLRKAVQAVDDLQRENAVLVAAVAEVEMDPVREGGRGGRRWKQEAENARAEADVLRDKLVAEEQRAAGLVRRLRNLHLQVAAADQCGVGDLVAKIRGMGPGSPALQRTLEDINEYFGSRGQPGRGVVV